MDFSNFSSIDRLAIFSTILGLANYQENIDQSTFQSAIQSQTQEIHSHLQLQDEKIDKILSLLENLQESLNKEQNLRGEK